MNALQRYGVLGCSLCMLAALCLVCQSDRIELRADTDQSQLSWNKQQAASYLDTRGALWLTWSGSSRGNGTACVSCHTGLPIGLSLPAVQGSAGAGATEQNMIANISVRVGAWDKIVSTNDYKSCFTYYTDQKPAALGTESVLNALVLVNYDVRRSNGVLSPTTKSALDYLWDEQQPDGSWKWIEFGLKPWEADGTYYGATLAAVATGMAGKSYYTKPELAQNITLLKKYLASNYSNRPLHDQVTCLWANSYLPGAIQEYEKTALIQRLLSMQDADGGWSLSKLGVSANNPNGWPSGAMYPSGSVSDGFATGLVAMALKRSGVPASSPQLAKARAWLVENEKDGSWPTNYINGARDPQSVEGGFMRDASTGFAVLALAEFERR